MANVVVQTAFIGDLLLTIPLLKNLGHYYQRHRLVLVCRSGYGELFESLRIVDQAIEVSKNDRRSYRDAQVVLNQEGVDNVFCPHESFRSALFVSGLKCKNKVGFKKWWNDFAFTNRFKRPMNYPEAMRQISLLARIHNVVYDDFNDARKLTDIKNSRLQDSILNFSNPEIPDWLSMSVADHIQMNNDTEFLVNWDKPVIFLAPGSVWRTKRWTLEGFIALGRRLIKEDNNVVVVGAPDEHKICGMISREIKGSTNLCGQTTLIQMLQLFKWGKALVSNDSGAMHMAACVDLPTVAVFGPTTLSLGYRPWNNKAAVVQKSMDCRPCGKHGANKCPLKHHNCMNYVHFEEVYKALKKVTA